MQKDRNSPVQAATPATQPSNAFMPVGQHNSMAEEKSKLKQFEVTFRDLTGGDTFADEYGFGTNPPAILYAESKKTLREEMTAALKRDGVAIVSIREVPE